MPALFYLLLALWAGTWLLRRLTGPSGLTAVPERPLRVAAELAAGLWIGLLLFSFLTYLGAYASAQFFPAVDPLLPANALTIASALIFLVREGYRRGNIAVFRTRLCRLRRGAVHLRLGQMQPGLFLVAGLTVGSAVFGCWLMWSTFFQEDGQIAAGYSVFSDLGPHLALVRSFAVGRNFPTDYPHFAGDGIHYHFLFDFLCGNLNNLGLPLILAINLPSVLALVSLTLLLAALGRTVARQKAAALLLPVLFFFRSSLALPLEALSLWRHSSAMAGASWPARLVLVSRGLWQTDHFIGSTLHDDWGLWSLNVYINQRHFLSGLALLVVLILLMLQDMRESGQPVCRGRPLLAGLIWIALPFWHGSVQVASLLLLAVWLIFLRQRLTFASAGVLGCLSAVLQSSFFAGGGKLAFRPQLIPWFLAQDHSLSGIAHYLLLVTGIAIPLAMLMVLRQGRSPWLLLGAAWGLILLTFTLSLTVDVTANHKFLMMALLLTDTVLSVGLSRLFSARGKIRPMIAVVLLICLLSTGLFETRIIWNVNRHQVRIPAASPLVSWIMANTAPKSIFLTAPYHLNAFFLSGRQIYYGHAYYAWSAGHATSERDTQVRAILAATELEWPGVRSLLRQLPIDYLIIDDDLRTNPDTPLNEAFFAAHFPVMARFPAQGNAVIYDLRKGSDD